MYIASLEKCLQGRSKVSPAIAKDSRQKKFRWKIITERCIFNVENGKVILTDVFPGIDIQNDILDQMEFIPQIKV